VVLLFLYWLLEKKIYPWYYGMESTSEKNRDRMKRVTGFALLSFFVVGLLRMLDIDFLIVSFELENNLAEMTAEELKRLEMENPDAANDGSGIRFVLRISMLVEVLVAFVVANLLDVILGEIVNQRFHRIKARNAGKAIAGGTPDRIKWLRPLLYTMVAILFANLTGLSPYDLFSFPKMSKEAIPITITVGRILNATFVFLLVNLSLSFFISFLLKGYYQRSKIDTGSQFAINRLLTYLAYFIGILLVVQAAGFNLIGIWTGAAALLVGIGIGLQQTFNDLICGVIILFERSVKVGDVIELSGHEVGTVRKVGTRTSIVETRDDIIIFVPNSKLIGENVTNWSQVERMARFHVGVGVAYGSDTQLVKELLIAAAKEHPRALDSPPPFVRFLDFGDSSLNFEVIFWSRDLMRIEDIKSDIRFAIDAAFRARGIVIPFPQRDLWIRGGLPGKKKGEAEE
jgi:small-conductance mechanosensitive channel